MHSCHGFVFSPIRQWERLRSEERPMSEVAYLPHSILEDISIMLPMTCRYEADLSKGTTTTSEFNPFEAFINCLTRVITRTLRYTTKFKLAQFEELCVGFNIHKGATSKDLVMLTI